jgi:hypothetical protein
VLVLAALALPGRASAGFFQVKDTAGMFGQADAEMMRDRLAKYPFDVRVVTNATLGSRNAFDRFVQDQIISPTMVVVGLDPAARRTSVHFGKATGIPDEAYKAIEEAGSASFRAGRYAEGVVLIVERAASVAAPTAAAFGPTAEGREPLALRWGFGAFILVATAFTAYLLVALSRKASVKR